MKIIIPYDPDSFFGMEEHSLLRLLELEDEQVLDQTLTYWTTYVYGTAEQIYEHTVDSVYEVIEFKHRGSGRGCQLQHLLSEHADQLTEIMIHSAVRLQQLLQDVPDEVSRRTIDTGEYHFLKVESINAVGKFAVITSDIADA